jgi:hypothetical protein
LPVLRGFSRNVKQDSEASNASGGMAIQNNPAHDGFATIRPFEKKVSKCCPGNILFLSDMIK